MRVPSDITFRFIAHTTPDETGAFTLPALPPGEYHVVAVDLRTVTPEGGDLDDPETLEELVTHGTMLTIKDGEPVPRSLRLTAR